MLEVPVASNENGFIDDVKNESIKNVLPPATSISDKHDEFKLNLTRAELYQFFHHVWNNVYYLAHLVIWLGFLGCLFAHHMDLRLQMIGARMRIACCSLIYRKVIIIILMKYHKNIL